MKLVERAAVEAGSLDLAAPVRSNSSEVSRVVLLLVWKDLRLAWRNRLRLQSLCLFGAALATLVGHTFKADIQSPSILAALVWTLTLFLQVFFLGQVYQVEAEHAAFEGLLLAPIPRWSIGLAKTMSGALLAGAVTMLMLCLLAWFASSLLPLLPGVLLLLAVETIAIVAAGSLIFAGTATGEEPAMDLFALVLLAVAPLVLLAQPATQGLYAGDSLGRHLPALLLCAGYAAGLVALCVVTFGGFLGQARR